MKKLHKKGLITPKKTKLIHRYWQKVYPDDKCHACKKKLGDAAPVEDSAHLADCPNVEGVEQLYKETWQRIREDIKAKTRKKESVDRIVPFLASTVAMRQEAQALAGRQVGPERAESWPCVGRAVGLVPRGWTKTLLACGGRRNAVGQLADRTVLRMQQAELKAFQLRCKEIARDRQLSRVYKETVRNNKSNDEIITMDLTNPMELTVDEVEEVLFPMSEPVIGMEENL